MKRLKTSLKTNMEQTTLTSLLTVKNAEMSIKTFNPDPVIDLWLSSAKTKRHVMGKQAPISSTSPALQRQHKAVPDDDKEQGQVLIFPPLPQLLDSDTDSE